MAAATTRINSSVAAAFSSPIDPQGTNAKTFYFLQLPSCMRGQYLGLICSLIDDRRPVFRADTGKH